MYVIWFQNGLETLEICFGRHVYGVLFSLLTLVPAFRPLDKGKNKASILTRTPAAHRFRIRIETCFYILFEQFRKRFIKFLTAQSCCHHLSLRIKEDGCRDTVDAIGFASHTSPALEVGNVVPR